MALITVTGTIRDFNGGVTASGIVQFVLSRNMRSAGGDFISRAIASSIIDDDDGTFTIILESTTDATPADRTYKVVFIGDVQDKYGVRTLGYFFLTPTPSTQNLGAIIFS